MRLAGSRVNAANSTCRADEMGEKKIGAVLAFESPVYMQQTKKKQN
jgi:hypothetical protein